MCLISYLPKGKEKYNETVEAFVTAGFEGNLHGSGLMWKKKNEENLIHIKKGFFNLIELLEYIKNLNLGLEDELAVHHRIGTQGANNGANTHPFIATDNHEICVSEEGTYNLPAMMHNGIFGNLDNHEVIGYSDTYAFAHGILSNPMWLSMVKIYPKRFEKALDDVIRSGKLCIMFPDQETVMIGHFIKDDGYYHSNSGYYDWSYRNIGGKESYVNKKKDPKNLAGTKNTSCHFSHNGKKIGFAKHTSLVIDSSDEGDKLKFDVKLQNKNKIIKLDDIHVNIDKSNYEDFIYMLKDGCSIMSGIKVGIAYKATSFIEESGFVCLFIPNNEKLLWTVNISDLKTCFYYHPLVKHKQIYNDYYKLIEKMPPTKSQLKKLVSQISSKFNHAEDSRFIVKKLGIPVCKRAVELYINRYKGEYLEGNKPTKLIVEPAKTEFNQTDREMSFSD